MMTIKQLSQYAHQKSFINFQFQCNPESKTSDAAGTHSFSFDRVFGPDVRQVDVFEEVAKPVVDGNLFFSFQQIKESLMDIMEQYFVMDRQVVARHLQWK